MFLNYKSRTLKNSQFQSEKRGNLQLHRLRPRHCSQQHAGILMEKEDDKGAALTCSKGGKRLRAQTGWRQLELATRRPPELPDVNSLTTPARAPSTIPSSFHTLLISV